MALQFDITRDPPALADITVERQQAAQARAAIRTKMIRFLSVAFVMAVCILCFQFLVAVPAVRNEGADPSWVAILALYTPYLIGAFFFTTLTLYNRVIEKPAKLLDRTLAALRETTPEELAEIAGSGQLHIEIVSYQQKVMTQGRALVRAEIEAIQRWLNSRRSTE